MIRVARLLTAALLAVASGGVPLASAADMIVAVSVDDPGVCGSAKVLNRITNRFRHQVRYVPNLPQVAIVDFYRASETRYSPKVRDKRPIERRYCHATATLSNGQTRDVWYLIERPMGFAGIGSNVEFCVSGFDRWHVYGGRCRTVRASS